MLTTIINIAWKTERSVLIALIAAGSLLTATSVQSVKAFEFTLTPWEVDHPDNKPMYVINRERDAARVNNDDNNDEIYNVPQFESKQSGAVNQNAQSSHFCIAWTCYQTTTTTQSVTADDNSPLVYRKDNNVKSSSSTLTENSYKTTIEDDGYIIPSSMSKKTSSNNKKPFNIDIRLTYKYYKALQKEYVRITVSEESGKTYEKTIDLANYRLVDGTPIKTRFTFGNGEVKVGEKVDVCVENMFASLGNNCQTVINGPKHEPESVTLVIPRSR